MENVATPAKHCTYFEHEPGYGNVDRPDVGQILLQIKFVAKSQIPVSGLNFKSFGHSPWYGKPFAHPINPLHDE